MEMKNERTMQQIYYKIYYTQYSFIYHKGQIRRNAIYVATLIIMLGLNVFLFFMLALMCVFVCEYVVDRETFYKNVKYLGIATFFYRFFPIVQIKSNLFHFK